MQTNSFLLAGIAGPRGRPGKGGQDGTPGLPGISAWMVNGAKASELLIPPSIAGEYLIYFQRVLQINPPPKLPPICITT